MKALRAIAKSHTVLDGKIILWFIPMRTIRYNITVARVRDMFGFDEENTEWVTKLLDPQYIFMLVEGHIVDIEFTNIDDDSEDAIAAYGLRQYWDNRTENDIANNWMWFENCVDRATSELLYDGYTKTRRDYLPELANGDKLKELPPAPNTPENQKKTGNGRKSTKKK